MARQKRPATSQMLAIVNEWMLDERFLRLMRWNESRHWLDYQSLKERNFRDVLAWLLSPREGHGLGDFFLVRLLQAACRADGVRGSGHPLWQAYGDLGWLSSGAMRSAMVATEVTCGADAKSKRRSDIVVADLERRMLVVIERKDGARASEDQLRAYRQWAAKAYDGFSRVFLLSDSQELDHPALTKEDCWIQLGDDWLVAALQEVVDRDTVPQYINQQLKDFLRQISDMQEDDQYFADLQDDLSAFVQERQPQVHELRRLCIPGGKLRFIDITPREAISRCLPECSDEALRAAIGFAARNHVLLQQVCDASELESLEKEIRVRFPQAAQLELSAHRAPRRGDDRLDITVSRFAHHEPWPLFLRIIKPSQANLADAAVRRRDTDRVFVRMEFTPEFMDSTQPPAIAAVLKEFACKRGTQKYSTLAHSKPGIQLTYETVEPFLNDLLQANDLLVRGGPRR